VWLEQWYRPRQGRRHAATLLATEIEQNGNVLRDTLRHEEARGDAPGSIEKFLLRKAADPAHLPGTRWLPADVIAQVMGLYGLYPHLEADHARQNRDLDAVVAGTDRADFLIDRWKNGNKIFRGNLRTCLERTNALLPVLKAMSEAPEREVKARRLWLKYRKLRWVALAAVVASASCLWAGLTPITGTLPDLGHRPTRIALPGSESAAFLTKSIRMGPGDEVHAWLQSDTTSWYLGVRCEEGTYRWESDGQRAFQRPWAPIPPNGVSRPFTDALCATVPRTFGQRVVARGRSILPSIGSLQTTTEAANPTPNAAPPQDFNEARLGRLRALVDRRQTIARLRAWLERGRDTATMAGVDSTALADRVLATCEGREDQDHTLSQDTLPDAAVFRHCAQRWLRELEQDAADG
jgi:hypothetical protein